MRGGELKDVPIFDETAKYDQSFHKLKMWKSFDNRETYIVLVPHNPDSIFKNLIQDAQISPHITLVKLGKLSDEEYDDIERNHLPYIKELRDAALIEHKIGIDLESFNIDLKVKL